MDWGRTRDEVLAGTGADAGVDYMDLTNARCLHLLP
jgi:hypothetical protein